MPRFTDTIAALATARGTSAIALIRVSGPEAARVTGAIFGLVPPARRATHADYRDLAGATIDDALFTFFPAAGSYTGEDAVEISCHGNPFIVQKVLEDLFARGCRAAQPGEFTQRAFLNGRMDLSQAEAVADLIHARSDRALAAANQLLRGGLGRRIQDLTDRLLGILAQIEAQIDFPEEDLPAEDRESARKAITRLLADTNRLLATSHYGELLREGIRTVIVGAPNAGKSSLLNRLVGHERAIVSEEPGTTRDFIEERIMAGPHGLRLVDTAGLNPTPGAVEKLGVEKSHAQMAGADLILLVVELGAPLPDLPESAWSRFKPSRTLLVVNKCDLSRPQLDYSLPEGIPMVQVSAKTGLGIETLVEQMIIMAGQIQTIDSEDFTVINARHADALSHAMAGLNAAASQLAANGHSELVASDLRGTLAAYGEIVGRIDNEQMLDQLFAKFCIGK
ncbi:MAG: tRNA uridine-5-carboxymethylaminomethyl(34) synthesis GTPase MnmE [Verrucomicrobia bacterium]|nr:tRNA uridine-5-carboxymethylaminomethyl(34) synthesis GTPase MnmE [Verrucomicrobiota bacterium]